MFLALYFVVFLEPGHESKKMGADEREQIRRGFFLPLYFTIISLMVIKNDKFIYRVITISSGTSLSMGSLGYLFSSYQVPGAVSS